jgi:hypothetical protein
MEHIPLSLSLNKLNANASARLSFFHPIYGRKQNIWRKWSAQAGGRAGGRQTKQHAGMREKCGRPAPRPSAGLARNPNTRTTRARNPKNLHLFRFFSPSDEKGRRWVAGGLTRRIPLGRSHPARHLSSQVALDPRGSPNERPYSLKIGTRNLHFINFNYFPIISLTIFSHHKWQSLEIRKTASFGKHN